jgi:polysaccharide biosynthesis protein PslG
VHGLLYDPAMPARRIRPAFRAIAAILLTAFLACTDNRHAGPDPSSRKRLQFSILEDYDKGEDLTEVAKDFDLFRELGVTTWRGSFGWDDYEPRRGAYDFAWLHRFADLAASKGIKLRPYIGYTPAWAAAGGSDPQVWNDPPTDLDDWYEFVRTLAAEMRRHTNIVSYEIYNEENVKQWWDGSAAAYDQVLRRGADAIKAGNPDAQLLLGGMVYPDLEWLESVCGDGGGGRRVHVIPFHAYPETWTPPDVTVENYLGSGFEERFVRGADAACGPKALWINETGYATTKGRTEVDQARWWVRAAATFTAEPRIEHIGIYEIKDLRPDRPAIGDAPNYHLGLTRADREKKLAFGTVARLVSMLGARPIAPSSGRVAMAASPPDADVHQQHFTRDDGRQVLFVWTRRGKAIVDVQLPGNPSRAIEYALDGTRISDTAVTNRRLQHVALEAGGVKLFEIEP